VVDVNIFQPCGIDARNTRPFGFSLAFCGFTPALVSHGFIVPTFRLLVHSFRTRPSKTCAVHRDKLRHALIERVRGGPGAPENLMRMFGQPKGFLGRLGGLIMSHVNRDAAAQVIKLLDVRQEIEKLQRKH